MRYVKHAECWELAKFRTPRAAYIQFVTRIIFTVCRAIGRSFTHAVTEIYQTSNVQWVGSKLVPDISLRTA